MRSACRGTFLLGGLPLSTSAPRGGRGSKNRPILRTNSLTAERTRVEGVKKSENFADVLNGSPLMVITGLKMM